MQLHSLLTSAPDRGKWSASPSGRFTSRERKPVPTEYRVRMGPRASLDVLEKKKFSCFYWDSNPTSSSPLPIQYTDHAIRTPLHKRRITKMRNRYMKNEVKCKILPMHNHQMKKKVYGNGGIIPRILSVARKGG